MEYNGVNYILINGKDIVVDSSVQGDGDFWSLKKYDKSDYVALIKESQPFFVDFMKGKSNIEDYKTPEGIQQIVVWADPHNSVSVVERNGKYHCVLNGRHRCAVAHELNLDILVALW